MPPQQTPKTNMPKVLDELDAVVQARVDKDADFQATLAGLTEEERTTKIAEKKQEELDIELSSIRERATKAEKAEEIAKDQRKRAEEAESKLKGSKSESQLSPKDYLALTENKISSEDFDDVLNYSKFIGKSVVETLKDKTMKTILQTRAEERRTAEATQTQGRGGTSSKVSPDAIIEEASKKGLVPDDAMGISELAEARMAKKLGNMKK